MQTVQKQSAKYAAQGYLDAQLALASCYKEGDGVDQNYKEVPRYSKMAVEQESPLMNAK